MGRLTNRNKEIPLPCPENALFWGRVHEKLARYEDLEEQAKPKTLCENCMNNGYPNFSPMRNADRIRDMSDEELADFLQDVAMQGGIELGGRPTTWLDWLRQEAKDAL